MIIQILNKNIYKKFYVEFSIKENNNIDNPSIKKFLFDKFKVNLNLKLSEFSHIQNKIVDNYQNLTLDELIDKLIQKESNLEKYIYDIKYEYKNKISERIQKIIIFGDKEHINLLNKNKCKEILR